MNGFTINQQDWTRFSTLDNRRIWIGGYDTSEHLPSALDGISRGFNAIFVAFKFDVIEDQLGDFF